MQSFQDTIHLPFEVQQKLATVKLADPDGAEHEIDTAQIDELVDADFVQSINTFDFNIFDFVQKVGRKNVLPCIGAGILQVNGLRQTVDFGRFVSFAQEIQSRYHEQVQYHNDLHGADTAQHVSFMLQSQDLANIA